MRWATNTAHIGYEKYLHSFVLKKPKWKKPAEGSTYTREDNIKMDFIKVAWKGMYWTQLIQGTNQK
jgi:hypothetical protein